VGYNAGWYPDPSGAPGYIRYYDGTQWTQHVSQQQPQGYGSAHYGNAAGAGGGGSAATTVIITGQKGVNHVLHLVLTIVTLGFWLPVWILIAIFGGRNSPTVVTTSAAGGGGGGGAPSYQPQAFPYMHQAAPAAPPANPSFAPPSPPQVVQPAPLLSMDELPRPSTKTIGQIRDAQGS